MPASCSSRCWRSGLSSYRSFRERLHGALDTDERRTESDLGEIWRIIFLVRRACDLLALGGGWWLMRRALAPVAALTRAAERDHRAQPRRQLPRTGNGDELDRLTEVFNAMTERGWTVVPRIREFTLHASHELKTPLTVMHGELETALGEDKRCRPRNASSLESELDEVQRLAKIVDGLTLLTKADAGQVTLRSEAVRLDELVREVFADAQILAQSSGRVKLAACEEATVRGDRHRLRQLLAQPDGQRGEVQPATGPCHAGAAAGEPAR